MKKKSVYDLISKKYPIESLFTADLESEYFSIQTCVFAYLNTEHAKQTKRGHERLFARHYADSLRVWFL